MRPHQAQADGVLMGNAGVAHAPQVPAEDQQGQDQETGGRAWVRTGVGLRRVGPETGAEALGRCGRGRDRAPGWGRGRAGPSLPAGPPGRRAGHGQPSPGARRRARPGRSAMGRALVGLVDLAGRRRMLDVGGGPGTYSALFTARHPQLRSVVLDLPDVVAIAGEILAEMGAEGQGTDPGRKLLRHAVPRRAGCCPHLRGLPPRDRGYLPRPDTPGARCPSPGGLLVLSDVMTDASGVAPPFATLFGLNMLLTAPHGGVHRDADLAAWMREAGMDDVAIRPFPPPMPHRVVLGTRSGRP